MQHFSLVGMVMESWHTKNQACFGMHKKAQIKTVRDKEEKYNDFHRKSKDRKVGPNLTNIRFGSQKNLYRIFFFPKKLSFNGKPDENLHVFGKGSKSHPAIGMGKFSLPY